MKLQKVGIGQEVENGALKGFNGDGDFQTKSSVVLCQNCLLTPLFYLRKEKKMKKIAKKDWIIGIFVSLVLVLISNSASEGIQIFEDDFNGTTIDSTKWNTEIATTGKRWCSSTIWNHHSNPGNWQDIGLEPCHDFTQVPPYGAITVSGGQAIFSGGYTQSFPYIWAGPPSRLEPFPSIGDFILEIRMKYDSIQSHGDGLSALFWNNTDPVGNNPPSPAGQGVFSIWADTSGLRTTTVGEQIFVTDPFFFHHYRLEYISGAYSLFIDGILKVGPIATNLLPNTIWIGNPIFTYWGISDWSDFTIDFVRVTVPHIEIPLDIKPQSCPNPLNAKSQGVLPIAILGTDNINVKTIDTASIRLLNVAPLRSSFEDVSTPFKPFIGKNSEFDCTNLGPDGFLDMTLKFDTQEVIKAIEAFLNRAVVDGEALILPLTGNLLDEFGRKPLLGEDVVIVISK